MRTPTLSVLLVCVTIGGSVQRKPAVDLEKLPFALRHAICYRTTPLTIDGKLDEPGWRSAPWSEPFIDIDGRQQPRHLTRVRMLWDDRYFYVAAELEEPDLWATLRERDSVIFQDNDFEVFIDPDGDTHNYYEIEVNAFATVWDLLLVQPYRDGGPAIHAWDIAGLRAAVDVRGTLNRPGDRDEGWSVEMALPWQVLREGTTTPAPPHSGDHWRVNFSRVQWRLETRDGVYAKRVNPKTGKPGPEDNWVWSPQGAVNMHMPERWGIVQFTDALAGTASVAFVEDPNDRVKWALRRLYYRQRQYRAAHGRYVTDLSAIGADDIRVDGIEFKPSAQVTDTLYEIQARGFNGATVHIRQDGRVWVVR